MSSSSSKIEETSKLLSSTVVTTGAAHAILFPNTANAAAIIALFLFNLTFQYFVTIKNRYTSCKF